MPLRPGQRVLVEATVAQAIDAAGIVLVNFTGPGGAQIPLPVLPLTVHEVAHAEEVPRPDEGPPEA